MHRCMLCAKARGETRPALSVTCKRNCRSVSSCSCPVAKMHVRFRTQDFFQIVICNTRCVLPRLRPKGIPHRWHRGRRLVPPASPHPRHRRHVQRSISPQLLDNRPRQWRLRCAVVCGEDNCREREL